MVLGSITPQRRIRVGSSMNGSMIRVPAPGIRIMSDSWMPFQPAIEEPSNILPSSKVLASMVLEGTDTCCSLPLVSVNRKSMKLIFLSLIVFKTSAADIFNSSRGNVCIYGKRWFTAKIGPHILHEICQRGNKQKEGFVGVLVGVRA